MELDIGRSVSYILIREYYIVGIPRHLRHGLCYCLLCCVASGSGDGESWGGGWTVYVQLRLGPEGRSLITELGHAQITGNHSSTGKQSIPFRAIVGEVKQRPKIQGLLCISVAFQITG